MIILHIMKCRSSSWHPIAHPQILVLIRLLAQQQLICQHPKGIHIALHVWVVPIKRLRRMAVLRPATESCRNTASHVAKYFIATVAQEYKTVHVIAHSTISGGVRNDMHILVL